MSWHVEQGIQDNTDLITIYAVSFFLSLSAIKLLPCSLNSPELTFTLCTTVYGTHLGVNTKPLVLFPRTPDSSALVIVFLYSQPPPAVDQNVQTFIKSAFESFRKGLGWPRKVWLLSSKIPSQKLIREVIGDVHLKIHCSWLPSFHERRF